MKTQEQEIQERGRAGSRGAGEPGPGVEKIKSFKSVKFDQTVECVLWLGIDPKQADQLVRGSLSLPHGVGKQKKVIAFCDDSHGGGRQEGRRDRGRRPTS